MAMAYALQCDRCKHTTRPIEHCKSWGDQRRVAALLDGWCTGGKSHDFDAEDYCAKCAAAIWAECIDRWTIWRQEPF